MYSVDTGHFYSNHEAYLHNMNCKYRKERRYIHNKLPEIEKKIKSFGYTDCDISKIKNHPEKCTDTDYPKEVMDLIKEYTKWNYLIDHKRQKAHESKDALLTLLSHKVNQNIITKGKDHIRTLREKDIKDTNVISIFDSSLSRCIGIPQDEFTEDLMVVQIYYFDVFKDLLYNGFLFKNEPYRYFTSSAGQIRKKKTVFIKESVWNRIEKVIMCGLTLDTINSMGGNNVNKHLAYMALNNSATDEWNEFDIDKSIVIEDFETKVKGTVDYIDDKDFSITRKLEEVTIPHTDGAGMILPSLFTKNFMVRLPWIKGLLGVFDFRKFIIENNCSPYIYDIYGKEHNVLDENIEVIFTKSQFKMYKFYTSWEQYKDYYKAYCCSAGRCNVEEDRIKNAKINYQMLQTLTEITDDEINLLADKSIKKITNICNSQDTMMDVLGVNAYNTNPNPFQRALKIYPSLLTDTYSKDVLRDVKDSLLKKYRSGKLEVNGKYTFILPDYYAACEYWFQKIENPNGLLNNMEVFCWLFKNNEQLDCLRSPHLYKEHAIRTNLAYRKNEKAEEIRKWFITDGIYTSTKDLISKILMFDDL